MILALAAAGLALALSLALTPAVRRLAFLCGATDIPDGRRVHAKPTARAGGLGVVVAVAAALALTGAMPAWLGTAPLAGAALLLGVGLLDDVFSLRPAIKLFAQVGAALLALLGGLRLPLFGPDLAILDAAFTLVWVVLITNAFNLSDGLDGLVTGIGIISCLALAGIGLRGGDAATVATALGLGGALLGFLRYNFNPATIFLGDAGSLVIGYLLAVLPLAGAGGHALPPLAALLLVAVPATDTFLAISRRFLSRCLTVWGEGHFLGGLVAGLRHTVSPDRRHIHHRLLDLGLSQRRAVLLIYVAATSTSALAYLVAGSPGWPVDLFALGMGTAVIGLVQALGIDELRPARSGLFLPVLRRLARRRWLLVTADLGLVAAAYGLALAITGRLSAPAFAIAAALALVAGTQLAVFAALGVYRAAWCVNETSGFGLLLRACLAGAITGYAALRLLALPTGGATALVHFLALLPAITMLRFSYVLLSQAARAKTAAEPALIFGTANEGRQALRRLKRRRSRQLDPIGFVEIGRRLQGRDLARLPVLGPLDALADIIRARGVKHLVVADSATRGEVLDWMAAVCRQEGVRVHRYVERLEPFGPRAGEARFPSTAEGSARRPPGRTIHNGASRTNAQGAYTNGNGIHTNDNGAPAAATGNGHTSPRDQAPPRG
jgi:UDP-GlcNAc:undecaprenyl-phosphate GlcNAc-1-phosphate transferase